MRSWPPSSAGRATAFPTIRERGWSRPGASRRSMRCAGGRSSTLRSVSSLRKSGGNQRRDNVG